MPRNILLFALVAAGSLGCGSPSAPGAPRPDDARFVTEDIARFWVAFDQMRGPSDSLPLRRDYLNPGTQGLTDFTNARWKNASTLAALVWPRRAYYSSVRANTLAVASMEPQLRKVYRTLDTLVSGAVFPDVYFAIGGMATGGTTSQHGLLIGTELFARAPDSPTDVLTPWQQSVVRPLAVLPVIVAHELTHYQQRYNASTSTLLAQSIQEGSADFIGELLSGLTINEQLRAYGMEHEAELWHDFSAVMNGTNISAWLYNGGSVTSTSDRPADLGYFIGYRITQAYYQRQPDKRQAVRDILTIRDFTQFLSASGYAERF